MRSLTRKSSLIRRRSLKIGSGRAKSPKKGKSTLKRKKLRTKQTTTKKADKEFSLFIRQRDGRCLYQAGDYRCPETQISRLQCSHYFARAISATRYDPDNCIALCYKHHYGDRIRGWEYVKHTYYREFMLSWLGEKRYQSLCERAESSVQRKDAIAIWETIKETL